MESPEDLRSITAQCRAAMANYTIEGVGSSAPVVAAAEASQNMDGVASVPREPRWPVPRDPGAGAA